MLLKKWKWGNIGAWKREHAPNDQCAIAVTQSLAMGVLLHEAGSNSHRADKAAPLTVKMVQQALKAELRKQFNVDQQSSRNCASYPA